MATTLTKATLELYVWRGNVNARPETPNYTLAKNKLSGEDVIVFEIAELVKDFVTIKFDGNYGAIEQSSWVQHVITYELTDDEDDSVTETTLEPQTFIAFRGYGNLRDGINPELSKDLMISNRVVHNKCGEELSIPMYVFEQGVTKVKYFADQEELDTAVLGTANLYTIAQDVKIAMPTDEVIKIDRTATNQTDGDSTADNQLLPPDTTKFTFTRADGTESTINIECIDECDYKGEPHKISFMNKFGVMQDMWFFGRKTDTISSERESYKRSIFTIESTDVGYDKSNHQNKYLENQGSEAFTLETGFIHESYNEVMRELMVSEFVYIHDKRQRSPSNPVFDLAVPVKVATDSLQLKSRRFDKLINYKLDFMMDSEIVQSIR